MEGRSGLSNANGDATGPGRNRIAATADDAFHLRMQGFGCSCGAHFAARELHGTATVQNAVFAPDAAMPLLPLLDIVQPRR